MVMLDPPKEDAQGRESWSDWIESHYELRDTSGKRVGLRRMGTSALMLDERAAGAPDFITWADVKKGANYTWEFKAKLADGKRYRCTFTVPQDEQKARRFAFERYQPDDE